MPTAVGAPVSPEPQPRPNGGPLPGLPMERSIADVIAERIRLRLARQEWVLPVLTTGENADWWASLEAYYAAILADVPEDDLEAMWSAVASLGPDKLLDFIYSYDKDEVLPRTEEFRRSVYPGELLLAVWEVRLAANPTQRYAFNAAVEELVAEGRKAAETMPKPSTSSSRRRTAGRSGKSVKH